MKDFEWFHNTGGNTKTHAGVPYNELFSCEEVRRLTFEIFRARKNQEPNLVTSRQSVSRPRATDPCSPLASLFLQTSWLTMSPLLVLTELLERNADLILFCWSFGMYDDRFCCKNF